MSIPIDQLAIEPVLLEKIRALNIDSIQELLSVFTAMENQRETLANALGIDTEALMGLKEEIQARLTREEMEKLSFPPPADEMPCGAFLTEAPESRSQTSEFQNPGFSKPQETAKPTPEKDDLP